MHYKHTQIGYIMIIGFCIAAIIFLFILTRPSWNAPPFIIIIMIFILFLVASLITLQVSIDGNYLQLKFSYGLFRKEFLIDNIVSAKIVRNHWYYGWGMRFWFWPKMWTYDVSGLDAVEIKLRNGKIYRIGTDEPKKLEQAILQSIK